MLKWYNIYTDDGFSDKPNTIVADAAGAKTDYQDATGQPLADAGS
jgi:hypothetical protein